MAVWFHDNNLCLNISKTKELIVDYRRKRGERAPIQNKGAVKHFNFLGIYITKDLTHTVMKRA
jgi:hypothetical protein